MRLSGTSIVSRRKDRREGGGSQGHQEMPRPMSGGLAFRGAWGVGSGGPAVSIQEITWGPCACFLRELAGMGQLLSPPAGQNTTSVLGHLPALRSQCGNLAHPTVPCSAMDLGAEADLLSLLWEMFELRCWLPHCPTLTPCRMPGTVGCMLQGNQMAWQAAGIQ